MKRFLFLMVLVSLPVAARAVPGSWSRSFVDLGERRWTLSGEGLVEVSPDGRWVERVLRGGLVLTQEREGELRESWRIEAGPMGRPSITVNGRPTTSRLPPAFALLVQAYWACEPDRHDLVIRSVGGVRALERREGELRRAWYEARDLGHRGVTRARLPLPSPKPDELGELEEQPGEAPRDLREWPPAEWLRLDSLAQARLAWMRDELEGGALEQPDTTLWLAKGLLAMARQPTPADQPHSSLTEPCLELWRELLREAHRDEVLSLALTWALARPGRSWVTEGPVESFLLPETVGLSYAERRRVEREALEDLGLHGSGRSLVSAAEWRPFLLAVPQLRSLDAVAWRDWVRGLWRWAESEREWGSLLDGALGVAPPADWAFVELVGRGRPLTMGPRLDFYVEIARSRWAGRATLEALLEALETFEPADEFRSTRFPSSRDRGALASAGAGVQVFAGDRPRGRAEEKQALREPRRQLMDEVRARLAALERSEP